MPNHERPRRGAKVHVWPTHAKVQNGAESFGRFMPLEGRVVVWDERHWGSRLNDGDISLTDPRNTHSTKPGAVVVPVKGE